MYFKNVMLGGSKTIGNLSERVELQMEVLINSGERFLVGDCHGADLAFQNYLHASGYSNVTVYCSGEKCRFNVGGWGEVHVPVEDGVEGYDFYRQKDLAMIAEADGAVLLWDGRSAATKENRKALAAKGAAIFTYRTDQRQMRVIRRRLRENT